MSAGHLVAVSLATALAAFAVFYDYVDATLVMAPLNCFSSTRAPTYRARPPKKKSALGAACGLCRLPRCAANGSSGSLVLSGGDLVLN